MAARLDVFADGLTLEVRRFLEGVRALPDVARVAVMPDVHLAGDACVGTVIATGATLRPALLGSDLGCGVCAMPLGVRADSLDVDGAAETTLRAVSSAVPRVARAHATAEHAVLHRPLSHAALERARDREGVREHGTIGRGNHFVELQEAEDDGELWVMVHSGSRALGPRIQAHHTRDRRPRDVVLDAESEAGRVYLADVAWAIEYAASSRRRMALAVADAVASTLGGAAEVERFVDCHHDAVTRELHGGEWLWVHRKGACAAPLGAPVLIPGSMGTASFHCEGRGEPDSMASSAHGAGRALPRGEAHRRIGLRQLERELEGVVVDRRRLSELVDEAPSAYHDVEAVMRAQRRLVRRVRRLVPRLVHK